MCHTWSSESLIDLTKVEEVHHVAIWGEEDDLFLLQKLNQEIVIEQHLASKYD